MYKIILSLLFICRLWSVNFDDFNAYQQRFTRKEIEQKIQRFLEKDPEISQFYQITDEAFYIGDINNDHIDYCLRFKTSDKKKYEQIKKLNLKGLKVAIDPGHFGGKYAKLERRYIQHNNLQFDEGTLTYLTALELKSLLESEGAIVFLSREGIGKGAIEENFFTWIDQHSKQKKSRISLLFRKYYNSEDLKARAKKINQFKPDLTVIIHFNSHLTQKEKEQRSYLTHTNYNLAFIPGAFCKGELNALEDRYEFLRLLVTQDIEKSIKLSECIVWQMSKQLNVGVISDDEKTSYTQNACLKVLPGVYSRNLALTRRIHGVLCYGESLVQNNKKEIYRLSKKDSEINGYGCSKRLKQVAMAYFLGIKAYIGN